MDDLISRQAAIEYFVTNVGFHDEDGYPIEDSGELRKIWTEYFDGIPSAHSEIVRCKDCKHWKDSDGVFRRGIGAESRYPLNLHQVYEGTFFCGLAEWREVNT